MQEVEPVALATNIQDKEQDFVGRVGLPEMPSPADTEADTDWRNALRHFHLTGEGAQSAADPTADAPLRPAVLAEADHLPSPWHRYPLLYLGDPGVELKDRVRPLLEVVEALLDDLAEAGESVDIVRDNRLRLVRAIGRQMDDRPGWQAIDRLLDKALERFADEFDLSEAGREALAVEIDLVRGKLPVTGRLLGLDQHTALCLWAALALDSRRPRTAVFVDEVRYLTERLAEVVAVDASHAPEASSADALEASMGGDDLLIDPDALAMNLPELYGSTRLSDERRRRIEATQATLLQFIAQVDEGPDLIVVHSGQVPEGVSLESTRFVSAPNVMTAAASMFDEQVAAMVEVMRAVRVARLDAVGGYDPELHDEALDYFDWQAFNQTELLLVPRVAVLADAEQLQAQSLSSFSGLLNSGRPVQVLVTHQMGGSEAESIADVLSQYHLDLSVLAVAHREAFVVESTLSEPCYVVSGMARMSNTLRAAVMMIAQPAWEGVPTAWSLLTALREGRDIHCIEYDPDAGESWAESFDISCNPQLERVWPTYAINHLDGDGEQQSFDEAVTFAHAAALDPAYRKHFRVVLPEAWLDEMQSIADYVEALAIRLPMTLPYIWVVDAGGNLARAVLTRELAFACRDRKRSWRMIQELGGIDNEYARRAAEKAREEALAEATAEREALEAAHAQAIETVRAEAAGEAMDRLVSVLMNVDQMPVGLPAAPAAPAPVAKAAPAEVEAAAPEVVEEEEEEAISFDEPYIDTMLCTTCNECTNLNPDLFKYNADKQAFIGDATKGTFAQLVAAAEKCPARCIHPGVPRPDDETATDDMVARAQPFN